MLPVMFSNRHDNSSPLLFNGSVKNVIICAVQSDCGFWVGKE